MSRHMPWSSRLTMREGHDDGGYGCGGGGTGWDGGRARGGAGAGLDGEAGDGCGGSDGGSEGGWRGD
eukprot:4701245-Prymnesium_polylepis.1